MDFWAIYTKRTHNAYPQIKLYGTEAAAKAQAQSDHGPLEWHDDLVDEVPWLFAEAPYGFKLYLVDIKVDDLPDPSIPVGPNKLPWWGLTNVERELLLGCRLPLRVTNQRGKLLQRYNWTFLQWLLTQIEQAVPVHLPEVQGPWFS